MNFDWDENKEVQNIKNHNGISFDDATKVFNDVWAIDDFDKDHSTSDEKRFTLIGSAEDKLLRVTFTILLDENGLEVIRIISVRKASGKDREGYEKSRRKLEF